MKDATTLSVVVSLACMLASVIVESQSAPPPDAAKLQQMTARFAPTDIGADLSKLSDADRRVLAKLVEASTIIDALFLRQVWAGNAAMLLDLVRDESPAGRARLHYFLMNKGPWSRLDHNQPFIAGAPPKPEGANFYPPATTKAQYRGFGSVTAIAGAPRLLYTCQSAYFSCCFLLRTAGDSPKRRREDGRKVDDLFSITQNCSRSANRKTRSSVRALVISMNPPSEATLPLASNRMFDTLAPGLFR